MTHAVLTWESSPIKTSLLVMMIRPGDSWPKTLKGKAFDSARSAIDLGDFKAESRKTLLTFAKGQGVERLLLIGLGEGEKDPSPSDEIELMRRVGHLAMRRAMTLKVDRVSLLVPEIDGLADSALGEALAEGVTLGSWKYRAPRKESEKKTKIPKVEFLVRGDRKSFQAGANFGRHAAEGTNLARELAITPSNVATPSYLVRIARGIARRFTSMNCRVLGKAELEKLEMGGILGVNQGSAKEKPHLIVMDYHPSGARKTVCLVGKGITFDTGGISIKPSRGMEEMKYDMCGAAAVLGAMQALGNVRPKVRVVALVPTTENMPSGSAIKPGDVIRTHGGLTVEVKNTDAEGRLILADALEYAKRYKPDFTVDLATLTGAIIVALGHEVSGLMSHDDELAEALFKAGEDSGERVWRLPLHPEYDRHLKSDVADLSNIGGPFAGSITAGAFLAKFAEGMKWAHLDIAGTAWGQSGTDFGKGPSGVGARLLLRWIEHL